MIKMENYTYMTLLTNNTYIQGVILLNETLKKVKSKYPLVVLVTEEVAQATLDILDYLKIKWKLINIVKVPKHLQIKQNHPTYNFLTKLQIYNQKEYDKICYLDSDIMVLKNIDFLFENKNFTCTLNYAYHKKFLNYLLSNYPKRINAGFLLFDPKNDDLNLITFLQNLTIDDFNDKTKITDDEEILQMYLQYKPIKINILNEYFNIVYWPENISQKINEDIKNNSYFIHFGGNQLKPWNIGNKLFKGKNIIVDNSLINNIPDYSLIYTAIDVIANTIHKIPPNLILNFSKAYIKEVQSN